jgi:hypothetical protein
MRTRAACCAVARLNRLPDANRIVPGKGAADPEAPDAGPAGAGETRQQQQQQQQQ